MWHLLFAYVCSKILSLNLALCCYWSLRPSERATQVDVLSTQTKQIFLMVGISVLCFFCCSIFGSHENLYFFQPVSFGSEFTCFGGLMLLLIQWWNLFIEKAYCERRNKVPNSVDNPHFYYLFLHWMIYLLGIRNPIVGAKAIDGNVIFIWRLKFHQ